MTKPLWVQGQRRSAPGVDPPLVHRLSPACWGTRARATPGRPRYQKS